jgi:hypothetical protein
MTWPIIFTMAIFGICIVLTIVTVIYRETNGKK